MAWLREPVKDQCVVSIRWIASCFFLMVAMVRLRYINTAGLELYHKIFVHAGLPEWFKFYGIFATTLELFLVIGVWFRSTFTSAIFTMIILSGTGVGMVIYSLILKNMSVCGCGILGDMESLLLTLKLFSVILLVILYKNKQRLF